MERDKELREEPKTRRRNHVSPPRNNGYIVTLGSGGVDHADVSWLWSFHLVGELHHTIRQIEDKQGDK